MRNPMGRKHGVDFPDDLQDLGVDVQDLGVDVQDLGVDVEFEFGVQPPGETSEPRWVVAAVLAVGVASLTAILALLPSQGPGEGIPRAVPATLTPEVSQPGPTATPTPSTSDRSGFGGGSLEEPFALLVDPDLLQAQFSLVELTGQTSGEQSVNLLHLDGGTRASKDPVYFLSTAWPTWPGAPQRPFVTAGADLVFPSRGQVVVLGQGGGESTSLGDGVTVIDGLSEDEFWVVGPDSRWVARHTGTSGDQVDERIPFNDAGRPLAAAGNGLVVVPQHEWDLGPLALWRPDAPLLPLPVPEGMALLGATADIIVLGDGDRIVSYDTATGFAREATLPAPLDMHRVSLSPDGKHLALSQRHEVTSLGELVIVNTGTGETVSVLKQFVDRDFAWTSSDTVVTLIFDDDYRLIEFDVLSAISTPVADVSYPWFYVAAR